MHFEEFFFLFKVFKNNTQKLNGELELGVKDIVMKGRQIQIRRRNASCGLQVVLPTLSGGSCLCGFGFRRFFQDPGWVKSPDEAHPVLIPWIKCHSGNYSTLACRESSSLEQESTI